MKSTISIYLLLLITACACGQSETGKKEWQYTWTYTYLKANENQKVNLKKFIIRNWFSMDSIAVQRGLFNDYQLLENSNSGVDSEWDFIVAVEYYTKGTYADIQDDWAEIRSNHTTVLVDGLSFPELGGIVKSEVLTTSSESKSTMCEGSEYDILKPFIGQWHEYLVEGDEEQLYGNLSVQLSTEGCALNKEFSMLTSAFSYKTLGYYDSTSGTWKETYTFSNGGYAIYEWKRINGEVVMELTKSSFSSEGLRRNRWTNVSQNSFQIISERSNDSGKTWKVTSTTNMKRIGM